MAAAMAVALPSLVCAQQPPSPSAPGDVAARMGDRVITVKELDEAWKQNDTSEFNRAAQALYEGRKAALDRIIAEMLIQQAAKARGLSPEEFASAETARRAKPVGDADVAAFFEQNQARMGGKPLDEMRSPIRAFLLQQQQHTARQAFIDELRKGAPAIRVSLDPPRQPVDVAATDPYRGGATAAVVLVEFSDYQ